MKKLLVLVLLGAIGTLGVSAWRGDPDGIFARFKAWMRPYLQRAGGGGSPPPTAAVAPGTAIRSAEASFRCGYRDHDFPDVVQTYEPDEIGLRAVGEILSESGLASNFKVLAGDVPNAAAFVHGDQRMIVYSNTWLRELTRSAQSRWVIYAVLAHEIAHHLNGDTIARSGDYESREREVNHAQELAADYFAGQMLGRLGATLDDTVAAVKVYGGGESHSHPDRQRRVEAHTNGWLRGSRQRGEAQPPARPAVSEQLRRLQHDIGRHVEHHGPAVLVRGAREVRGVVQYKLLFVGSEMRVKGILYDQVSRDVTLIEWELRPEDGRPHAVDVVEAGSFGGARCYVVRIANAGELAYPVATAEAGSGRDPHELARLLRRYLDIAGG